MYRTHETPAMVNPNCAIEVITVEHELFRQLDFNTICIGISQKKLEVAFLLWLIDQMQLLRANSVTTENEKIIQSNVIL